MQSGNGLMYASGIYLDHMATNWDALVLNDYEYVMPLPWRRKWLIHYIYPPAFVQQLGIFSGNTIDNEIIDVFIKNIPGKYKFCEIPFNYANNITLPNKTARKNYLLNLAPGYNTLQAAYSRSANRNISKAKSNGIGIAENIEPEEIIRLHRKRFADNVGATKHDYGNFTLLAKALQQQGTCYTFGAADKYNNLIAGSIYFLYRNRLTFILNGNSKESLECGATHLLKDFVIQKFSSSNLILDFEGSDTPGFARFYEQFGAKEIEYYSMVKINRLPFFLRLLKH